ncbi:exonuclease domain-containing protein [Streptomyces sp. NPDC127051]|uniref:3'-5' exonuclease n=1 Tax=Streptomyces sp. NPDC127051 TaxID=3347119 RepID=UPI0036691D56
MRHPPPDPRNPQHLPHLFTHTVDTLAVQCVRSADTDRPTWAVYQLHRYLGTLQARPDSVWYVQATRELHSSFDNAIRALRRPPTWPRDRAHAVEWAHHTLGNPNLRIINIQTTGLHNPRALQIAISSSTRILFNQLINPQHPIEPAATRLHHHTHQTTRHAPTFSDVLPLLTDALQGRHCVAYNLPFVRHVLHAELKHHRTTSPITKWPTAASWADAIPPISQWAGFWSARQLDYQRQRLHSPHEAASKCQTLLHTLHALTNN